MGMVQKLLRSRRVHLVANVGFATVLLAVAVVSARHFVKSGWPLKHADPVLVAAALLLFPMASVAAADASSWAVRAGFLLIAVAGIAAAVVICYLPKIARLKRLQRFRFARWVADHTHCTREAWAAWLLVSFSWSLRGTAIFLLLHALAMGGASFPLALAFL